MDFTDKNEPEGDVQAAVSVPEVEQSQEDRIAWLRDRGVEIDIPGEKKSDEKAVSSRVVTVVKIPCNDSLPYEAIDIIVNDSSHSDQMITLLKPFFVSRDVSIKEDALKQAAEGLLQSSDQATHLTAGKDRLTEMLKGQGHVESFSLTRPSASNGWVGVTAYLDEAGQLKGLARNKRASALAGFCGFDNISLLGDIYIGRLTREGGSAQPSHISFTTAEVDSSCAWIRNAHRDNYQHSAASGRIDMTGQSENADLLSKELESCNPSQQYKWTQTEDTVDVIINTKAAGIASVSKKDIVVSIKASHLSIVYKGLAERSLLDIALNAAIKPSDSTWSMSGSDIEVSMEKAVEEVWQKLEK